MAYLSGSTSETHSRQGYSEGETGPGQGPADRQAAPSGPGLPSVHISGHSSASENTREWKPWDRQQKRVFHRSKTILTYWAQHGYTVAWVMLSSSPASNPDKLSRHHGELRRRIERVYGFKGIQFFQVKTTEGCGVIHCYWAWKAPDGYRGRPFIVPQAWLSEEWKKIHGASVVWISRMKLGGRSVARVTRYVVTQYLVDQEKGGVSCLDGMSWSWRRTFGFPLVKMWNVFKDTYSGSLRVGLYEKWNQFLAGSPVRLAAGIFDIEASRLERGWNHL